MSSSMVPIPPRRRTRTGSTETLLGQMVRNAFDRAGRSGLRGNLTPTLDPPEYDEEDALAQKIRQKLKSSIVLNPLTDESFIPRRVLIHLFSETSLSALLRSYGSATKDEQTLELVTAGAMKTFAILVFMNLRKDLFMKAVVAFVDSGVNDSRLPIDFSTLFDALERDHSYLPVAQIATNFCTAQHLFLAPEIYATGAIQKINKKTVLPFMRSIGNGSGSDVIVHPDHIESTCEPHHQRPKLVAVRQVYLFKGRNERPAILKMLNRLNEMNDDHIAHFLTAVYHLDSPNLLYTLFDRANGGTLLDLWELEGTPLSVEASPEAVFLELYGMLDALISIYRKYGFTHRKLRPTNIFWHRSTGFGTLKIGGWEHTSQYSSFSLYTKSEDVLNGHRDDLWAFGCVVLGMLVWLIFGTPGLHAFLKSTGTTKHLGAPFFQRDEEAFNIHPTAQYYMNVIGREPAVSTGETALGDLFELAKTTLLVPRSTPNVVARFIRARIQTDLALRAWLCIYFPFLMLISFFPEHPLMLRRKIVVVVLIEVSAFALLLANPWLKKKGQHQASERIMEGMRYIRDGHGSPEYWSAPDRVELLSDLKERSDRISEMDTQRESDKELDSSEKSSKSSTVQHQTSQVSAISKARGILDALLSTSFWSERRRALMRPRVKWGYRRIEWVCDCGSHLYADLPRRYGKYIDDLASSLQRQEPLVVNTASVEILNDQSESSAAGPSKEGSSSGKGSSSTTKAAGKRPVKDDGDSSQSDINGTQDLSATGDGHSRRTAIEESTIAPTFLAMCINIGGMYKKLVEIDLTKITSDASLFEEMKTQYQTTRGWYSKINWLVKVTNVSYIEFKFWNYEESWIKVCKSPLCVPDANHPDYEPRMMLEPPPMPEEVFIHYLEHGNGKLKMFRNEWLPNLPRRRRKHERTCYAYGVHIVEGPHGLGIFIVTMVVLVCTAAVSVTWCVVNKDVQGGTGIGGLIIAGYATYLTAWIHWRKGS